VVVAHILANSSFAGHPILNKEKIMERKEIVKHDNGSVTTEGEGVMGRYLDHEFDHAKGKGECDEHTDQYGHEDMHNIPHNDNPISEAISKGVEKVKNLASDYGKNIAGTLTQNPSSLKKVREKQGPGFWQAKIE
jgi:hypothetical protein